MLDLGTQLRDYLDVTAPAVDLEDIAAVPTSHAPVGPLRSWRTSRPIQAWVSATAAAIAVLLLVGGAAWLFRGDESEGPVATTTVAPTTVAPTTVAPPTVAPTTLTPTPSTTSPEAQVTQLVAQVVTPSAIGDARWTVYENISVDVLESFADAEFSSSQDPAATLSAALLSAEGIVTRTGSEVVGRAGEITLTRWGVSIDWKGTVLSHGGDELSERSNNGDLLLFVEASPSVESGSIETYLFANSEELQAYQEAYCCGDEPPEGVAPSDTLVASYEWTHEQADNGWVFEVVDTATGDSVGSVSSAFPLRGSNPIFALSQGEASEVVTPEWFARDIDWFHLDNADSMLVYVKQGDSNSSLPFEIWRSIDGVSWQNLGPAPGFPPGYFPMSVSGSEGLYVAYLDDITGENEPGPDFLAIRSENGIDWTPVDPLPTTDGSVHQVDAGWVLASIPGEGPSLSIWTSLDATNWQPLDTSGLPATFFEGNGGASGWTSSGNRLYVTTYRDDPALARLWIVEFPSS